MNKIILKFLFLYVYILFSKAYSQKENYQWYFGNKAALNFATNPPGILNNSAMLAAEGCASVADSAGNLLFYTNGVNIWNKQHQIMANGNALYSGNPDASQSSIIIQNFINPNIYYLFTLNNGPSTLAYSLIDMSLAAGFGSVTVKSFTLASGLTEKLSATRHCNGTDSWILTHLYNSNNFLAFQLSATGINTTAVISSVGSVYNYTPQPNASVNTVGCMKISPDAKRIAITKFYTGGIELFDFDNSTGIVSNPILIGMTYNFGIAQAYGCEFSPDATKVYASGSSNGTLFQWDLCAGTSSAIAASVYALSPTININKFTLQLAPNGKIYLARSLPSPAQNQLGVINNPNDAGAACNYVDIGQGLGTATCGAGLPNFSCDLFRMKSANFTYTYNPLISCATVSFSAPGPIAINPMACTASSYSVLNQSWIFGDPTSGTANTSTLANPQHTFTSAGIYKIKLLLYYSCHCDTLTQMIIVTKTQPNIGLIGRLNICSGQTTTLTGTGGIYYQWSNVIGSSASIVVTPSVSSTYTLTAFVSGTPCPTTKIYTVNVSACLDIKNTSEITDFKIYPNPANSFLVLETEQSIDLKIYNEIGQLVNEFVLLHGEQKIDISRLNPGIYFLLFSTSKSIQTLRFLKLPD